MTTTPNPFHDLIKELRDRAFAYAILQRAGATKASRLAKLEGSK